MTEAVDVLGLGNSLVDIIAHAGDDYLRAQEMIKGAMTLIDEDRAEALYAARVDPRIVSGGSAANTIVGVASFGVSSAYIGKVKNDALGYAFAEDIRATGVDFATPPAEDGPATGRCFVYVTPDGERTMNTYLGASTYLSPPDVDEALVRASRIVYLEGYMWDRPAAKSAFQKAAEIARQASHRVALDAVRLVLRRSLPRRIHRSDAPRPRRHAIRQHRRDSVALSDDALAPRRSTRCGAKACSPS